MKIKHKNKKEILYLIPLFVFMIILMFLLTKIKSYFLDSSVPKTMEENNEENYTITKLSPDDDLTQKLLEEVQTVTVEEENSDEEKYATSYISEESENLNKESLTEEGVKPLDTTAVAGEDVTFQSYDKEATDYIWETYDMKKKSWVRVDSGQVSKEPDELNRMISVFHISAARKNDGTMIRCRMIYPDGSEKNNTAFFHVLDEEIEQISISDFETEAGEYVNILSIPTTITLKSGRKEEITGLYGLHFLDTEEFTEYGQTASGNTVETRTTVITECNFAYLDVEEKDVELRYKNQDYTIKMSGIDVTPPTILSVSIGDYQVISEDKSIPIEITIDAEDDQTPYPNLTYAFVHESRKPQEKDFGLKNNFKVNVDKNGKWIAYVRDNNGNVSKKEETIITVDQKSPLLTLSIKNEEWCNKNEIIALGEDQTEIKYRYVCAAQNIDSDWTSESSYEVKENGVYIVSAIDAAGNMTTEEISITNIDHDAPIIRSITQEE